MVGTHKKKQINVKHNQAYFIFKTYKYFQFENFPTKTNSIGKVLGLPPINLLNGSWLFKIRLFETDLNKLETLKIIIEFEEETKLQHYRKLISHSF